MNPAYISALAALAGSAIGAIASFATTWLTQNVQERNQRMLQAMSRRERLYGEFIDEASSLFGHALTHELEETSRMVHLYAIRSKLRLFAPDDVTAAADDVMQAILHTYAVPNLSIANIQALERAKVDVLHAFTESCRRDLQG